MARFIASFYGDDGAEIDVVERHQSLGRIEDKAGWVGVTGEVSFPVGATSEGFGAAPLAPRRARSERRALAVRG